MTRDLDLPSSGETVVVLRDGIRSHRRAGALRGGCPYLGTKGRDLSVFAKRFGLPRKTTASPTEPFDDRQPRASSGSDTPSSLPPEDAPRLYHGLPSGTALSNVVAGSENVIHSLEFEMSAIAERLQRRASFDASPLPGSFTNKHAAESATPEEDSDDSGPTSELPPAFCHPSRRWDDFGRDSRSLEQFNSIATFLTKRYFRTRVTGIDNIPAKGPCLLVANHSGALPIDGLVIKSAIWAAHSSQRHIRWLTEDFVQNLPFVGTYLQRLGAVRASRENVLRLLQNGECVVAFPEGFKGYAKPVAQWYRVQRLGRGRIVSLCLQAGVPLLPCAVVGGEEATPSIRRLEAVERWLGTPYFPITPTFPWLGPLGLLPAPSRWHIDIGPPFLSQVDPAKAEDPLQVAELTAQLRTILQQRLDRLVAQRRSTWFG